MPRYVNLDNRLGDDTCAQKNKEILTVDDNKMLKAYRIFTVKNF